MTITFGQRRLVLSIPIFASRGRTRRPAIAPELDDQELVRLAQRFGTCGAPAWERSIVFIYGGVQKP